MNSPSSHSASHCAENTVQVAAFDVDHTLTNKDCVVPFLREVAGWHLYIGLVWRVLPLSRALFTRDRDRVKAIATRVALAGRSIEQVDAKALGFASRVFPAWLREDTVRRLRWHHSQGHKVVLVSASYSLYLKYLGKLLGCDAVMGTECETNAGSKFTGSLVGANCRGAEKERRLREWLDGEGFGSYVLYAYGDSAGDDQMLAMADHAFRITKEWVAEVPELSAV